MTKELRTIDITPKWSGVVNHLLDLFRNAGSEERETLKLLREEFKNMAQAADLYNETRGKNE